MMRIRMNLCFMGKRIPPLRYPGNAVPLMGIPAYAKKYNVPETTVRFWVRTRRLPAIYAKGRYAVRDIDPNIIYTYNCYNAVQT